jgi:hypothetical protein
VTRTLLQVIPHSRNNLLNRIHITRRRLTLSITNAKFKGGPVRPLPSYYKKISIACKTTVVSSSSYANIVPKEVKNNPILEFIEQGSRVAFAIALCALVTTNELNDNSPLLLISIVFLVLYYIVWIRYFAGGRKVALLGTKFLFVPMPLVIFPVLYYLFASLWLNNYVATAIVIAFGISHNIISYQNLYAKE